MGIKADRLVEHSKNDNYVIVGSEVRGAIEELKQEINILKKQLKRTEKNK